MKIKGLPLFLLLLVQITLSTNSYAAHPLITDDAGTQGKGKFQVEVNCEISRDKESEDYITTKETGNEIAAIASYGLTDSMDIVLGLPYEQSKIKEDGETISDEDGTGDMSVEIKWRFFENDGLAFAFKPAITLPTGDEEKGLGNGKASYALTFITSKEMEPWLFHVNIGYMRNEYKLEEDADASRKDLWHVSLASEFEAAGGLRIVANIGTERNPVKELTSHPAFVLGGLIYSITENFDIDTGVKAGLNKPETDLTFLAGMAVRY